MAPKQKSKDAGNSGVPEKNCKVLSVSEKVSVYRKIHGMCRVWYYLPMVSGIYWKSGNLFLMDKRGLIVVTWVCKNLIEEVVRGLGSGLISSLSLGISQLWEQLSLQYQQGPQCQKHQNKKKTHTHMLNTGGTKLTDPCTFGIDDHI